MKLKQKQQRSKERREKIVAAATRLFGRRGIDQTSLTDVARLAGVPLPSIYDYFKGKPELVAAVPEDNYRTLYLLVTEGASQGERARDQLREIYLGNLKYITANPDWGRVFFLEIWPSVAVGQARIRQAVDRYALRYVELVRDAIASGDYRKDLDPYLAMTLLMGGLCQLTAVWLLYRRPYDLVQRGGEMFDLLEMSFLRPDVGTAAARPGSRLTKTGKSRKA